jgi:hypothetical protein
MRMQMIQRFTNGETDPIFGVFGDSRLRGGSHRTGERCRLLPICRISRRLRCPARCGAASASGRACRYASRGDPGSWCGRYPHQPRWPGRSRRPPLIAKTSRAAPFETNGCVAIETRRGHASQQPTASTQLCRQQEYLIWGR